MATSDRSASACLLGSSRKSRIRLRPVDSVDRTCAAASAPLRSAFALGTQLSLLGTTTSGPLPLCHMHISFRMCFKKMGPGFICKSACLHYPALGKCTPVG